MRSLFLFLIGTVSALAGVWVGETATPFTAMSEVLVPHS